LGIAEAFGWHLTMAVKYPFEVLIKGFNRAGAQFMKDAPDFNPRIGMWIPPIPGGHQRAFVFRTERMQLRRIVMAVAQDNPHVGRQATHQAGRDRTVGGIGGRQFRGEGDPDRRYTRREVQFPAIDPPMPARFRLMGVRINGCMRHLASRTILRVPHAATRTQQGAIHGRCTPAPGPRLDACDEPPPDHPNEPR
jgi:hypothetical protein